MSIDVFILSLDFKLLNYIIRFLVYCYHSQNSSNCLVIEFVFILSPVKTQQKLDITVN